MTIVSERPVEPLVRRLRAGLKEKVKRWEREDDAKGPEPEAAALTRTFLPVGPGWAEAEPVELPALSVPAGYIVAGPVVGADEMRARHLVVAAQGQFGWGRSA
ncbi:hypothetical protein [Streptomyces microflavus]|uniref:Uncharacterized protein n=1 Tax=Streptomyces microflavus TaxID=1919 RepID=A0A7H8N101_STRMI|nr:hypothetical protein [Streptomyces microflavus]QKW48130.1 hypothetical protein HUT09_36975 [Streptomyces microflavus]